MRDEIILAPGQRKRKVSVGGAVGVGKSKRVKLGIGSWARRMRRVFAVDFFPSVPAAVPI